MRQLPDFSSLNGCSLANSQRGVHSCSQVMELVINQQFTVFKYWHKQAVSLFLHRDAIVRRTLDDLHHFELWMRFEIAVTIGGKHSIENFRQTGEALTEYPMGDRKRQHARVLRPGHRGMFEKRSASITEIVDNQQVLPAHITKNNRFQNPSRGQVASFTCLKRFSIEAEGSVPLLGAGVWKQQFRIRR